MAVLHDLEGVAFELNVTVKVHLVERFHGNLVLATVSSLVGRLLEREIVLDGAAGKLGFLVGAWAQRRDQDPVAAK